MSSSPTDRYHVAGNEDELEESSSWWMERSGTSQGRQISVQSGIVTKSKDSRRIESEEDIAAVRAIVKRIAVLLGFSILNQTKVVTAASEIARNTLEHGGGGTATIEVLSAETRPGIRIVFEDKGQGIKDIDLALQDGFSTGPGMGLGLGGTKRLTDEFDISSEVDAGTRITITKWG
jgi:serine/threonine-protein kinase RsbT